MFSSESAVADSRASSPSTSTSTFPSASSSGSTADKKKQTEDDVFAEEHRDSIMQPQEEQQQQQQHPLQHPQHPQQHQAKEPLSSALGDTAAAEVAPSGPAAATDATDAPLDDAVGTTEAMPSGAVGAGGWGPIIGAPASEPWPLTGGVAEPRQAGAPAVDLEGDEERNGK